MEQDQTPVPWRDLMTDPTEVLHNMTDLLDSQINAGKWDKACSTARVMLEVMEIWRRQEEEAQ